MNEIELAKQEAEDDLKELNIPIDDLLDFNVNDVLFDVLFIEDDN